MTVADPRDFGLASFADLPSSRPPIPGEVPGGFDASRAALLSSLTPMTPYECVVAENLVAIEWELFQRRRMREAVLRKELRKSISAAGGGERDWKDPHPFDRKAALARIHALTDGALSNDPQAQAAAYQALTGMGVSLADLMGEAYAEAMGPGQRHDAKAQELERRRREVMRDYAAIQKARPIDHVETAGDVEDAVLVSP